MSRQLTEKEFIQRVPTRIQLLCYRMARIYYHAIPSTTFTIPGAIRTLVQILLIVGIAALPVLFQKYVAPMLHASAATKEVLRDAWYQTALLAALQIAKFASDAINRRHHITDERQKSFLDLSLALSGAINAIEKQISRFAKAKHAAAEMNSFLNHALKCIEETVHLCTENHEDGYCGVTLLTFEDGGKVKIRARSKVSRRINITLPQEDTLAYWAAKFARQSVVVHHFRKISKVNAGNAFRYKGLSLGEQPPYESILLFPLPPTTSTVQNRVRKGVVTIDSARPYEFLGEDADILNRVQAYLDLINLMLTNHRVGVVPEI